MNKKRVKKKWGDKGRECFTEVEDCCGDQVYRWESVT